MEPIGERKSEEEHPKPEVSRPELPKINIPRFRMPKMPKEGVNARIRNKFKEYARVMRITKKPNTQEFKAITKASGLGMVIIGIIGFIIHMIVQGIMLLR